MEFLVGSSIVISISLLYLYLKEKIEQKDKLPFDKKLCSVIHKIENREKTC